MDETLDALARWDWQQFLAFELTLETYRGLGLSRAVARRRVEFRPDSGPADLVWFDLRWPEEP